jgi:hypothetical protein
VAGFGNTLLNFSVPLPENYETGILNTCFGISEVQSISILILVNDDPVSSHP